MAPETASIGFQRDDRMSGLTALERLDAIARQNAPPVVNVALSLSTKEVERYSVVRVLTACREQDTELSFERELSVECWKRMRRPGEPAGYEAIIPYEVLQRDLSVASGGSYLASDIRVPMVADAQRPRGIVRRAGATFLTGLGANVSIGRQSGTATVKWLSSETDSASESQQTIGAVALAPKTVSAYTELSDRLWRMAPALAEFTIRRDLVGIAETALDQAALNGSGASGQPLGIMNTAGVGTFNGASITWANVIEAQTDVLGNNAAPNPPLFAYTTTPAIAGTLAQRQGFSTNAPIWLGGLDEGTVAGARALSSNSVPSATIVAGDWSQLVVGEFGPGIEVRINPYANFPAGILGLGLFYSVDVGVLFPNSFTVATSVS